MISPTTLKEESGRQRIRVTGCASLFGGTVPNLHTFAESHGRQSGEVGVKLKAHELLGWIPPVEIEEGVGRTVDWFLRYRTDSRCFSEPTQSTIRK
jgi:nucleoside-diphosphate-sugar epimerase